MSVFLYRTAKLFQGWRLSPVAAPSGSWSQLFKALLCKRCWLILVWRTSQTRSFYGSSRTLTTTHCSRTARWSASGGTESWTGTTGHQFWSATPTNTPNSIGGFLNSSLRWSKIQVWFFLCHWFNFEGLIVALELPSAKLPNNDVRLLFCFFCFNFWTNFNSRNFYSHAAKKIRL